MRRDFDPMLYDEIQGSYHATGNINRATYDFSAQELSQFGGSVAGLVSGALGMSMTKKDIDASNDALMTNLQSQAEALTFSQSVRQQQSTDLANAASNRMSSVAYEQMVTESSAAAASAESGGSTNTEAIAQAAVNANFQAAQIQGDYKASAQSLLLQSTAELLSFENTQKSMLSQQLDPMNAALRVASAGMSSFASGQRLFT